MGRGAGGSGGSGGGGGRYESLANDEEVAMGSLDRSRRKRGDGE